MTDSRFVTDEIRLETNSFHEFFFYYTLYSEAKIGHIASRISFFFLVMPRHGTNPKCF